jgi:hypothetical protein
LISVAVAKRQPDVLPGLLVIAVMAAIGYVMMRALVFDLVDEMYLGQDELIVRNGGEEERVPLSNVINVNATVMTNPERITLTLREPSKFGKEIVFEPPLRFWHFGRHPLAAELIQLADAARGEANQAQK